MEMKKKSSVNIFQTIRNILCFSEWKHTGEKGEEEKKSTDTHD